ncbi:hypothetical protein [Nostoc flagelliforme]|uniref:hypothetical protein n=1 Tax=Nostoc flagelliforme TaxID=1306274 RepID=UPI0012FDCB6C|nr:hypothetical protein [Nostoc flagelliforme]
MNTFKQRYLELDPLTGIYVDDVQGRSLRFISLSPSNLLGLIVTPKSSISTSPPTIYNYIIFRITRF